MTERPPQARRLQRRVAACVAVATMSGVALAQSDVETPRPEGFPAGSAYIAPSLTAGYAYNSNIFLNSVDFSPTPDEVVTLQPALQLTIPFSNSSFKFSDTLTWLDYQKTPQAAGKTSNDASADLTLRFGSLDTLAFSATRIDGVAETLAFDPGGEVTFDGNAYKLHTEGIRASREIDGTRGYRLSLERNVLHFDTATEVFFFDFRGFDAEAAYLQPLSSNTRLAIGYVGSRYDHYDLGSATPDVIFRTERGDVAYGQIEGRLGPKQPYKVRLGWEWLDFSGGALNNYSGVVGDARLNTIVGGGTVFSITGQRQPYRSFFDPNNFYIYDDIVGRIDRPFPRGSSVGVNLTFSKNAYRKASPLPCPYALTNDECRDPNGALVDPGALKRQDRAILFEAYANLAIREHAVFRVSIVKNRKYSNFPGADYNATVVFGGFVFGWI